MDIIQRASFSAAVKADIPFTFHLGMRTSIYGWRDSHKQIPALSSPLTHFPPSLNTGGTMSASENDPYEGSLNRDAERGIETVAFKVPGGKPDEI